MQTESLIPDTLTVNETIRRFPATVAVFKAFGIDACCGGALPVATAAARHGIDPGRLVEMLEQSARGEVPEEVADAR